jgi:hypothetical protein
MAETLTSISRFNRDSIIKEKRSTSQVATLDCVKYHYSTTGSLNKDYAYSIELMRLGVRQKLNNQFHLQNDLIEIDFLVRNPEILNVVFEIKDAIIREFGDSEIALDLQSESDNWKTLFIVVSTNAVWERANSFINLLFKKLFKTQPEVANKINLIIAPDAI